jgi:hypothetical protein
MSTDARSAALPKPSPNSCIFLVSAVSFGRHGNDAASTASTAATRRSRTSGSPYARPCRTRGRRAAAAAGNANCRATSRARIR